MFWTLLQKHSIEQNQCERWEIQKVFEPSASFIQHTQLFIIINVQMLGTLSTVFPTKNCYRFILFLTDIYNTIGWMKVGPTTHIRTQTTEVTKPTKIVYILAQINTFTSRCRGRRGRSFFCHCVMVSSVIGKIMEHCCYISRTAGNTGKYREIWEIQNFK